MDAISFREELARTVPDEQAEVARITYRYLRWLMVLLPAVLLVVTGSTAWRQNELESSISAYYGGPVRDVFVGVMIGTAACMVAYQGVSLLEDYALNGAGFYAVFVALVPTNLDETLSALRANPTPDGVTPADYISFLRSALTTVLVLCAFLVGGELRKSKRVTKLWQSGTLNKVFVMGTGAVLLWFLARAMVQLWGPDPDDVTMDGITLGPFGFGPWPLRIHDLAAIFLIASLAVVVASHAWPKLAATQEGDQSENGSDLEVSFLYVSIFVAMLVLGPVFAWVFNGVYPDHGIIFLEWWEIGLFSVFWFLETRRIGKMPKVQAAVEARRPTEIVEPGSATNQSNGA